jgi:hypothetical protein
MDGQTDMTKLNVAFRSSVKALKMREIPFEVQRDIASFASSSITVLLSLLYPFAPLPFPS